MPVDLLQRWMAAVDQVSQVVDRGRLILDQDKQEVQRECRERLPITCLVDSADVWDALFVENKSKQSQSDRDKNEKKYFYEKAHLHIQRSRS